MQNNNKDQVIYGAGKAISQNSSLNSTNQETSFGTTSMLSSPAPTMDGKGNILTTNASQPTSLTGAWWGVLNVKSHYSAN